MKNIIEVLVYLKIIGKAKSYIPTKLEFKHFFLSFNYTKNTLLNGRFERDAVGNFTCATIWLAFLLHQLTCLSPPK
jgi:hypothetical protein